MPLSSNWCGSEVALQAIDGALRMMTAGADIGLHAADDHVG